MTIERQARILFVINAVTNWVISARGIIDPVGMAFVFMFGCMFWETSRDVVGKRALIKYNCPAVRVDHPHELAVDSRDRLLRFRDT